MVKLWRAYQCNHNSTDELGKGIDYKKYDSN